jgi:hypothetical protein
LPGEADAITCPERELRCVRFQLWGLKFMVYGNGSDTTTFPKEGREREKECVFV